MPRKKTVTPHAGQRQLRIAEEIRHALAGIIAENHLSDPDLAGQMVTVTLVKISPDLRNATIFITPFGIQQEPGNAEKLVRALNRAAGYFRGEIARQVEMRVSPQLRFKIDDSFEEASRIEALLHDPVVRADLAKAREDEDQEAEAKKDPGAQ
ncbi:MAG: 30S ribosome-binding factor RbfA [Rhodospirillaceae bacterium]|nr:30S ribosome-binding factor RbfA [Rhodospirillaceae bacterium]